MRTRRNEQEDGTAGVATLEEMSPSTPDYTVPEMTAGPRPQQPQTASLTPWYEQANITRYILMNRPVLGQWMVWGTYDTVEEARKQRDLVKTGRTMQIFVEVD